MSFYALGYNLPIAAAIVGFGLGLGKISNGVKQFGMVLKDVGGGALLIMGFYFLIVA